MKRLMIIVISILFCSCNSVNTEKRISDELNEANDSLKAGYERDSISLDSVYAIAKTNVKDQAVAKSLNDYYVNLEKTFKYIDSLKSVMAKIEKKQTTNNPDKEMLTKNGTGVALFRKIEFLYNNSVRISKNPNTKETVLKAKANILNDPDYNNLLNFYFDSGAGTWVLYGFESELMKTGIVCFKDYTR